MRTKLLYVSPDVYDALWQISKVEFPLSSERLSTPDAIADGVLRNYINDKYPKLFDQLSAHQKGVDALEKKLIEGLRN